MCRRRVSQLFGHRQQAALSGMLEVDTNCERKGVSSPSHSVRKLVAEKAQRLRDVRLHLAALDHCVQESVVQQKLAALKASRQLLTDRLLDHPGPRETDQRSRLGDIHTAQHRETRSHATGGRVGQYADEGQALLI